MAILRTTLPIIAAICLLLPCPPFSSAADKSYELATKVCKNTTDFDFCRGVVFPDPRAAAADRVDLAYIIFNLTYINSTSTQEYIEREIKSIGGGDAALLEGLKKCRDYYKEATRTLLYDMLGDLDSDSYSGFDKASLRVKEQATACVLGLRHSGGGSPAMRKRNGVLVKLADVCYAVSLLFPYS
ncbi:hypothetical protein ABFS82_13G140300 [Erythranthe guttata]|uniref:Pectinesterase inhibitor domain-containing protein n=1 Tax=Erythranthe guttata TaxID=4155 RepID=A0A022QK25_ERYGU|nr:PREDICTED: uncharacterized protein LOC105968307 [Erythranthe guttata]EYU27623.1 hypothetical protein MIMGU_mgv1a018344mg [Erythranthe guttata]|eukprot:XP_012848391.1 PREDICTED: uncharacterized protein LOC105968307 [Erythranthe guttata]